MEAGWFGVLVVSSLAECRVVIIIIIVVVDVVNVVTI